MAGTNATERREGTYTPRADVTQALPDGRLRLLAPAGVPMPIERAREIGLLNEGRHASDER